MLAWRVQNETFVMGRKRGHGTESDIVKSAGRKETESNARQTACVRGDTVLMISVAPKVGTRIPSVTASPYLAQSMTVVTSSVRARADLVIVCYFRSSLNCCSNCLLGAGRQRTEEVVITEVIHCNLFILHHCCRRQSLPVKRSPPPSQQSRIFYLLSCSCHYSSRTIV